jgi:hypothetical protein
MKKIINAIRDFLYNITDYGLIITVIVIMAVILGWRFEILFNRGIDKEIIDDLPEITEPVDVNEPEDSNPENPDEPGNAEVPDNSEEPGTTPETPENPGETGLIATVTIPEGSFPSSIADILLNSNLIKDKQEFLNRSMELGLDTKLRSGTFEIEVGTSLDNVIKKIANAQ